MATYTPRGETTPTTPRPFEHAHGLIEVLPDRIDVEEEAQLYDDLCDVRHPEHATGGFAMAERSPRHL